MPEFLRSAAYPDVELSVLPRVVATGGQALVIVQPTRRGVPLATAFALLRAPAPMLGDPNSRVPVIIPPAQISMPPLSFAPSGPSGPPPTDGPTTTSPPPPPPQADAPKPNSSRRWRGLAIRAVGGLALLLLAAGFLLDRYLNLSSSNAELSARLVTLRTPVEGELVRMPARVGDIAQPGEVLATVHNTLVDDRKEAELAAALVVAEQDARAVASRRQALAARIAEASAHAAAFRTTRSTQLTAELAATEADLGGAQARLREAAAALQRTQALFGSGVASAAALDQVRRAAAVAQSDVQVAVQRRARAASALGGVEAGVFGADNATDRSTSQQAADQLRTVADQLEAEQQVLLARVASISDQLAAERRRLSRQRDVDISMHGPMRMLRVAATPGAYLQQGQDIATLADCSEPIATALVSETVFRALHLGMTGEFKPAAGGEVRRGTIVDLTSPVSEKNRQVPYTAVLRLEPTASDGQCEIGRLGAVRFHT